jgi:hypothetical protein
MDLLAVVRTLATTQWSFQHGLVDGVNPEPPKVTSVKANAAR